jgi:hypothetical protein
MKTLIALFTRGRVDRQKTLQRLTPEALKRVHIFCHPGELAAHQRNWGGKVASIEEYSTACRGVGDIRDYIVVEAVDRGFGGVFFLDDNVSFSLRLDDAKTPVVVNNDNFTVEAQEYIYQMMFDWVAEQLDTYAVAALSYRPFNRDKEHDVQINGRFFSIWGLNIAQYLSQPVRFSDWPIKEDFALACGLRRAGLDNVVSYQYSFDKMTGANAAGGCSIYRTIENSNAESQRLREAFPEYITLRTKKCTNWGGEMKDREMIEVKIHLKGYKK